MATQSARSISLPVATASVIAANRLVELHSDGTARQANAVADVVVGVALEASTDSQDHAISVALLDGAILEIEAGGTVTRGGLVTLATDGRVVNRVSGSRIIGSAVTGGAAGELVEIATTTAGTA